MFDSQVTFQVWVNSWQGPKLVDMVGAPCGPTFALHPSVGCDGTWSVSHVKSGYSVARALDYAVADALLMEIHDYVLDVEISGHEIKSMTGDVERIKEAAKRAKEQPGDPEKAGR